MKLKEEKLKKVGEVKWKKLNSEDIEKFKINSSNLFGKRV